MTESTSSLFSVLSISAILIIGATCAALPIHSVALAADVKSIATVAHGGAVIGWTWQL